MKVACMQMDMKFGCPEINFLHAEKLICEAVKEQPDVLVLPETWNTGFFPKEDLTSLCCNSCGTAEETIYGGNSAVIDPFGKTLALAGENEEILTAECDLQILNEIRNSIPVFRDRRSELYKIKE